MTNTKQAHTPTTQRVGPLSYEASLESYVRLTARVAELGAALREVDALMRECYLGPVCNDDRWQDGGKARIMAAQESIRAALAKGEA